MRKMIRRLSVIALAAATALTAFPQGVYADYLKGKTIVQEQLKPDPGGFSTSQGIFATTTVKATSKALLHYSPGKYSTSVDRNIRRYSNYLSKPGGKHRISAQNKLNKALERSHSNKYKASKAGKLLKAGDKAVSAYSIYKTGETYLESKHTHSSMRLLSRSIKGFDMGMNGADMAGMKGAGGVAIVSGYTKDTFESDEFASYMNSQDNATLRFLDDQVDLIDDYWTKQFYDWFFRPAEDVGVYKPNIYIYPAEDTDVNVKFAIPGLLTKVIPDYNGIWDVTAKQGGKLIDANGNTYDYLFYESDIQASLIDLEGAFLIPAEGRDKAFKEMLSAYGLNEKEIADFCEFWSEKLEDGESYLAYEVLTDDVDALMPIEIDPQPESILRLWFFFVPYEGQEFIQAQPEAFVRDGFTVVEWGGLIR
jgi:hypothetical protein